ncbi:alpha-ketoacid dehydrogenase kinase [Gloeophyllum trabeum ATCC 11539]|uniref:Protein-serine/threonine kinase n=1 Tax=Gloeophyllum trabeum (strain ATCC 11539 / FP-39264 / Madison 617) TaxID=670483 RepID=S7QEK7_GLOTA|nr:alpha-ketoacid dehydrogenase kinase [Gloeophyllum trabeum ATCC 11539]EPQ58256.1 alpha-ketoacid dehydrogenase kinase [Gloeophyllum trabeum ATCC 11539]
MSSSTPARALLRTRTRRGLSTVHRRPPDPVPSALAALLEKHSQRPPTPLTLATLLSLGRPPTPRSVLKSVSYAQAEIPRRMAQRVMSLQALPFIVGTNPFVARVLEGHRTSFLWLASQPAVTSLEENAQFTSQLESFVQSHANDIPTLAKGFQECTRYMSPTQISNFLDGAIRNRIAVRLIAEQHIAISRALSAPEQTSDRIGVVDLALSPARMIKMCGSWVAELCEATLGASPELVLDGHVDATFVYVPVHLEYIATEILKNSFRATVEHHYKQHGTSSRTPLPAVRVTICPSPKVDGRSHIGIRIRDQGGGVSPANMARIFSYAFTTADRSTGREEIGGGPYAAQQMTGKGLQVGMGTIAGLGYGLPMSRLYAKYFGGSLDLFSLDGWGSDVFVQLKCLDEAGDVEI